MKYIELKKQLKSNIENAYIIYGDDRYLCFDALKKIENALSITIKDMNMLVISSENITAKEIVETANTYPFGDLYRLVIVKNFEPKTKDEREVIQNYLKKPLSSTVLVFFNLDGIDAFKNIENLTKIDCSKIDAKTITAFIKNELAKNNIASTESAISTLIEYSNNDMSKITNELEKLIAYVLGTKVITEDIVKSFVSRDREFQVYQLSEFIAKDDIKNAIDLVESFSVKSNTGFQIITTLYNNYRRALFVSLNKDKTSSEMATILGVKEFAVKMLKNQIQYYSSKKLKKIVDMIAKFDKKIKNGEIKENIAIKTIIFNIIEIKRGNDD